MTDLLAEMALPDPAATADQLVMLRDGAMVRGHLDPDPAARTTALVAAGRAVLDAARAVG
nr:hypothetical protein [Pseudonocardia lacus]